MVRPVSEYNKKRNFDLTSEPPEEKQRGKRGAQALRFVIQKHDARNLHYDFRLEMNGTLKSWAIPKGPSLDPNDKRLAVHVENHPLGYAKFEGSIPKGQYGGGEVIVWDEGVWQPQGDVEAAYQSGKLKFTLVGEKLSGDWALVRTRLRGSGDKEQWLLIKERDDAARPASEYDILKVRPESVITGELLATDKVKSSSTKLAQSSKPKLAVERSSTATASKSTSKTKTTTLVNGDKKNSKKMEIPHQLSPQLATLVSEPPPGEWLYEIKFDGYRMLARVLGGNVNFFTRNGNDWTSRLPQQMKAMAGLQLGDSWLDGELVVLNENGLPDFQALQSAFDSQRSENIIYYLFDAPYLNGADIRDLPVQERRKLVEKIVPRKAKSLLRYSAAFDADHRSIVESACAMSLEGVIGKRAGSPYVSRRSDDWIKLKCRLRQEFVIVGYTEPQRSRSGFGAILLGVYKEYNSSELIYAGRVGTGFNKERLADIYKKMNARTRTTTPVSSTLTSTQIRGVHWIEPELVCEVEFAEWTSEGNLRQASFIALRTDKPAKDIVREEPRAANQSGKPAATSSGAAAPKKKAPIKNGATEIPAVKISNADRIIDPATNFTKMDIANYYENISEFILPHLKDRPVSLLRAPDGIASEHFFQKHSENRAIPHITQLDAGLDPAHAPLMTIDNSSALIGCVQMNTIELHTWSSTTANIELPDRFVLDLDPDPALPWRSVVEATRLALALLDELKLTAFLKTTGGKGMHILVPLTPDADWATVKQFSKTIAEFMANQIPSRFVAKMGPKNRIGKIFIDYLRNTRGASTVSAYSVRARPGLPISVPIARDELEHLTRPDQWNIGNLDARMKKLNGNPWGNYSGANSKKNQKITKVMWKKLGVDVP